MKALRTDALRKAYIDFFVKKHSHVEIPGASLIPENDPTVLFTTAGMHPLVPYLLGQKHPAGTRVVDIQRCVRTIDIDEVGDASHLTMFEMLGNWSFGDYFKEEAITMSFEFLTKILEIPLEKLAVTCFDGDRRFPILPRDEESAEIWKSVGMPAERIGFLEGGVSESKKNWWGPAGKTGPCGPDTEMFYWVGPSEFPPSRSNPENDEQNWLEIWNDVFMQYDKTENGTFEPLQQQNVDTGMGLERVAAVMEGVDSVYDTDPMKHIKKLITGLVTKASGEPNVRGDRMRHVRIMTDHLRAATFIIADGVEPSNVDQGYVLRKLIRRAVRSGFRVGIKHPFCSTVAAKIVELYGNAYPHLQSSTQHIRSMLEKEEQQFQKTLEQGMRYLQRLQEQGKPFDGQTIFHLYDTLGFPPELTEEILKEAGYTADMEGFQKAFEEHQKLSRTGAEKKFAGGLADHSAETTKLHTATHLLGAALRKVLGPHVQQKGSNITAERLRFDFNHPDKMTPEQLMEVERLVNEAIDADLPIAYHLTTVDGAKKEGAIGVFDERYGNEVKVYHIGPSVRPHEPHSGRCEWSERPFSIEICGGPHVARTGMLGKLKIQKEESSSAGIRRIKAVVEGGPKEISVAPEEILE